MRSSYSKRCRAHCETLPPDIETVTSTRSAEWMNFDVPISKSIICVSFKIHLKKKRISYRPMIPIGKNQFVFFFFLWVSSKAIHSNFETIERGAQLAEEVKWWSRMRVHMFAPSVKLPTGSRGYLVQVSP